MTTTRRRGTATAALLRLPVGRRLGGALGLGGALVALVALAPSAASAQDLAYLEASSELDKGRPATYVFNLVDGKPTTAWCSEARPGPHTIVFGFKEKQRVTHLGIVVGMVKGEELDKKTARVRRLAVSDGAVRREIEFKDEPGLQEIKLDPAVDAVRVIIDVASVRPGKKDDGPVCIGEILLKDKAKELTGAEVYKSVRARNTPERRLLNAWVDEPSAPERTLLLALDGTFSYVYEPLLEGKPVSMKGKWTATGSYLNLEAKGKKYKMRSRLTRIDDGEQQRMELSLSGEGPDPSFNTSFRKAPVRYE